ncbi:hypothetical protein SNEBB_004613 [Seison nebaliae]|nr:hypothetical protein SNEBB_004613 [Seison nebaliae]
MGNKRFINYSGEESFRQRLILSSLFRRPIIIQNIRCNSDDFIGLKNYEMKLLVIIDELSNGSQIEVNKSGTRIVYFPGSLCGGNIEVDLRDSERSVGYFIEFLFPLCVFSSSSVKCNFINCVTHDNIDPTPEELEMQLHMIMNNFLPLPDKEFIKIKTNSYGMWPNGNGQLVLECETKNRLVPQPMKIPEKIKRIRGYVFVHNMANNMAHMLIDSVKEHLLKLTKDVYINILPKKSKKPKDKREISPGYGIVLFAETRNGITYTASATSKPILRVMKRDVNEEEEEEVDEEEEKEKLKKKTLEKFVEFPLSVEEIAVNVVNRLYSHIYQNGSIDIRTQWIHLLFMALSPSDQVTDVLISEPTKFSIDLLRLIDEIAQKKFHFETINKQRQIEKYEKFKNVIDAKFADSFLTLENEKLNTGSPNWIHVRCRGTGFENMNRIAH